MDRYLHRNIKYVRQISRNIAYIWYARKIPVRKGGFDFAEVRIFHVRRPFRFLSLIRAPELITRGSLRYYVPQAAAAAVVGENGAESRRATVSLN